MKFSVASVLAAAAGASALSNVTYTTEVVTAITTYCPAATVLTHGGKTYTVTEATTLTITNCPCTITKPVTTSTPAPVYVNSTAVVPTPIKTTPVGTISATVTGTSLPTAGAGKTVAMSGGALAGVLGLAAFLL